MPRQYSNSPVPHICEQCGDAFLAHASAKRRYCSNACARIAIGFRSRKQPQLRRCHRCGETFAWRRIDTSGKYCSRACSDSVNKNPPAKPWIPKACGYCGETFLCPPWNLTIEHCSTTCAKRHAAQTVVGERHPLWKPKTPMACEACGTVVLVKPCHVARFRACSRRCACVLGQQAWPRISSIERAMAEAFGLAGLIPVAQHIIGPYIVDFAFPPARVVVECDGVYWHGRAHQRVKDARKDAYLTRHGWRVLRLSEQAINDSATTCAEKVASLLHQPAPLRQESP